MKKQLLLEPVENVISTAPKQLQKTTSGFSTNASDAIKLKLYHASSVRFTKQLRRNGSGGQ